MRTGTFTRPNEIEPVQIARGILSLSPFQGRVKTWQPRDPEACSSGGSPGGGSVRVARGRIPRLYVRKRSIIQMVLVGVLAGAAVAVVAYFVPWLPDAASEEATSIDRLYWFVTIVCIAIFSLVAAVSIYSVWKFRAPP